MKRCPVLGALLDHRRSVAHCCRISGDARSKRQGGAVATKIEKVKDNLYVITGSARRTKAFSGGNTAVFITDAGIVVVDTKLPGWGPTILQRIKTVSNKPITTIINTHTHSDHTGSNEFFGAMVDSVVQENTKANMAKMDEFKGDKAKFLPKTDVQRQAELGKGKDEIDLYYFGRGHTDGDTFRRIPGPATMHAGDMFAWKGSALHRYCKRRQRHRAPPVAGEGPRDVKNVDTVIGGHIPVATWNDFKEYADFTQDFADYASNSLKDGKSVDQAAAEYKVPSRFKGYMATVNPDFGNAKTNLQIAYDELKK